MCTSGKTDTEDSAAVATDDAVKPSGSSDMNRSPSSGSLASTASSTSVASSCSTSFSERDPEWYLDVVLGFAEKLKFNSVASSELFSSKAGGRPVWLYRDVPPPPPLQCRKCDKVLSLLLQLYAPLEDNDAAFHRFLYLFVCRASGCAGGPGSARVLASQLPRRNVFYAYDAEDDVKGSYDERDAARHPDETAIQKRSSCALCGFAATAHCGQCKEEWYCSRDCQRIDWRIGHRQFCRGNEADSLEGDTAVMERKRREWLLTEFEIVNESCPTPGGGCSERGPNDGSDDENVGETDDSKVDSTKIVSLGMNAAGVEPSLQDVSPKELPKSLFESARREREDNAFRRFSEMMRDAPDQVVRYWRGGRPLWAARGGRPGTDEQTCSRCGGPNVFELQVLPQILYVLGVESGGEKSLAARCGGLDFGTIAIFSCAAACGAGPSDAGEFTYAEEVAHVQRIEDGAGAAAAAARAAAARAESASSATPADSASRSA